MPSPNPNNPLCPTCGKHTTYNMTLNSGARQYRCKRHKPNYTCTDSDRPVGRPPDGKVAMTQVELNQRYRDANREKYRAAEKVRKNANKLKEVKQCIGQRKRESLVANLERKD